MTTTFSRGDFVVTPQLVINAGVIGFGFIGEVHVRAIRAAGGVVTAIAAKTIEEAKAAANNQPQIKTNNEGRRRRSIPDRDIQVGGVLGYKADDGKSQALRGRGEAAKG